MRTIMLESRIDKVNFGDKVRLALGFLTILLALLSTGSSQANLSDPDLLPAEQAFVLQFRMLDNNDLEFYWQIAPGYFLYQDQLQIVNYDNDSILKNKPVTKNNVYANDLLITIAWDEGLNNTDVTVRYQGCAANGFCYAPISKQIHIAAIHKSPENTSDKLAASIKSRFLVVTLGIFFALGVLLAFTPCVLPMLPLIINLILGQKPVSSRKALILAGAYVFGMAGSYAIAGMIAAIVGSSLQSWLQQPLILITLSLIIVVLALTQFEVIKLSLPHFNKKLHHWGQQQLQGSVIGSFILGILASLIISPCITPPLIGVLTYIGQDGSPIIGLLTLFSLGLGMGAPLILVATLSSIVLPTVGPWIILIKNATGIALLSLAIWIIQRIMPDNLVLILWSGLAILSAILIYNFKTTRKYRYITAALRTLSFILAVAGTATIIHTIGASYFTSITKHTWVKINSQQELNYHLTQAKINQQATILEVYADWCTSCKKIEAEVIADSKVQKNLARFVLLRVDITNMSPAQEQLMRGLHIYGPPTIVFFNRDGSEITAKRIVGNITSEEMVLATESWHEL